MEMHRENALKFGPVTCGCPSVVGQLKSEAVLFESAQHSSDPDYSPSITDFCKQM